MYASRKDTFVWVDFTTVSMHSSYAYDAADYMYIVFNRLVIVTRLSNDLLIIYLLQVLSPAVV